MDIETGASWKTWVENGLKNDIFYIHEIQFKKKNISFNEWKWDFDNVYQILIGNSTVCWNKYWGFYYYVPTAAFFGI